MTVNLLIAALLTSIVSGTLGMGGGVLLLAVMAQYFPIEILIPLHGLIQLGSNFSRVIYSYKHCERKITWQFAMGAIIGALAGAPFVVAISDQWYKIGLGIFILLVTFVPLPRPQLRFKFKWPLVGAMSSFLGLFVGGTGPLIAPFYLSENLRKENLVATKAACQIFIHLFKVATFFTLGFMIEPYLFLLIGMLAMVFVGNYIGKVILHRVSDRWFMLIFKTLILILSVRMILQGAIGF
jgi:uncharacterized membrane protein YfcA